MNQADHTDVHFMHEELSRAVRELECRVDELKIERKNLQDVIAHNAGRKKISRDKIEKLQGEPSLYVGQRLFERALSVAAKYGINDPLRRLSEDKEYFSSFLRSHGIPAARPLPERLKNFESLTVHSFKGQSALVELRGGKKQLFLDALADFSPIATDSVKRNDLAAIPAELLRTLISDADKISLNLPRPYVTARWLYARSELILACVTPEPPEIPILPGKWNAQLGKLFQDAYARTILPAYLAGALDNTWGDEAPSHTYSVPQGQG